MNPKHDVQLTERITERGLPARVLQSGGQDARPPFFFRGEL